MSTQMIRIKLQICNEFMKYHFPIHNIPLFGIIFHGIYSSQNCVL
jgi:hypothetical protein